MHTFIEHIHIWGFSVIKQDFKNITIYRIKRAKSIYTRPIDIVRATIYI